MSYVNIFDLLQSLHPSLTIIGPRVTFGKIFRKINRAKNCEFVWVKKARTDQMTAVLILKIIGKKFLWIQSFENPPAPTFITKLLLSQADRIIVDSRKDANKLKSFGINKSNIRLQR